MTTVADARRSGDISRPMPARTLADGASAPVRLRCPVRPISAPPTAMGPTTVRPDLGSVGSKAGSALLAPLAGGLGLIQHVLPSSLVVRQSTSRSPSLGRQLIG